MISIQRRPVTENQPGGLQYKGKCKVVYVYQSSNPERCTVHIFKMYVGLLPQTLSCRKLYLRPRKVKRPNVSSCDQPFGVNRIKTVVKDVCKEAELIGNFIYHSLHVMYATHMFDKNVQEQVIKETTGHCSECVRLYLRKASGENLCKKVKVEGGDAVDCLEESKQKVVLSSDKWFKM